MEASDKLGHVLLLLYAGAVEACPVQRSVAIRRHGGAEPAGALHRHCHEWPGSCIHSAWQQSHPAVGQDDLVGGCMLGRVVFPLLTRLLVSP